MKASDFLEAYAINSLINGGESYDTALDILNKRYLKLSYNTGAMEVTQTVMLDDEDNFYGLDAVDRLVMGRFIDERYLVFYILNKDHTVTRFIGYNSESHITITFVDTKISTGLRIEKIDSIDESMSIASTYHNIKGTIREIEKIQFQKYLECINQINEYQKPYNGLPTIVHRLKIENEVPVIKELTK